MKIDDKILDKFARNLLIGLMVIVLIGLPGSLSRIQDIGFIPEQLAHIILSLLVILVFIFRQRITARHKLYFVMFVFASIALAGMFSVGMPSQFLFFSSIMVLLIALAFGMTATLVTTVIVLLMTTLAAFLFVNGYITPEIDYNQFMTSWTGWLPITTAVLTTALVIVASINSMHQLLLDTQQQLDEARKKAEELANHDALTGLLSLRMADERMKWAIHSAKRKKKQVALIFLDLNGFKSINDQFGHQAGDVVLKTVAKRLTQSIREVDSACRVGGDEFFVILPDIIQREDIERICQRIIDNIDLPIDYKQQQLSVGISAGIALYPDDALDTSKLKNLADKTMYKVKRSSNSGYAFSSEQKLSIASA